MNGRREALWRRLLPLVILALAVAACFRSFVLTGEFRIADDTRAILYPVLAGFFAQLRQGQLALWWPEILLGYPGVGSVELHLFSPFHWPFLFFRPELAIALRSLSIHLVSAVSMYALCRHLRTSRPGALAAGLIWALAPPAVFMLIEPMASATVPWFPLVLLCWDRVCRTGALIWSFGGGLALGVALLGGHLQHALWFGAFLAGYTLVVVLSGVAPEWSWRHWGRVATGGVVTIVVALAIGAVELLPSWELFQDSIRVTLAAHERLPRERPTWLGTLHLLGATVFTAEAPELNLEYARVGLVPLALALLAVGRGRRFDNRLLVLACAFLLLAFGDVFPPTNWLIRTLPGNLFRFAERIGLVFTLAIAVLAGRGADVLLAGGSRPWRRLLVLGGLALVVGLPLLRSPIEVRHQEVLAGLVGLVMLGGALAPTRRVRQAGLVAALAALLVWSARNVERLMSLEDAMVVGLRPAATREGPFPPHWLRDLPKADDVGPTRLLCLACERGNTAMLTGQETPTGYVTLRPQRVERLVYGRRRVGEPEASGATLGRRQVLLDLLGVRYLIVRPPVADHVDATQLGQALLPVHTADGLVVLENRRRLPRSFFVSQVADAATGDEAWSRITEPAFDPRQVVVLEGRDGPQPGPGPALFAAAHVTQHESGRVEVTVDAPAPGFLVLLDRWARGWQCDVNGRPALVLRADYLFRAVQVSAGRSNVVFRYSNPRLAWGAALTLAGVGLGVFGVLIALRRPVGLADAP